MDIYLGMFLAILFNALMVVIWWKIFDKAGKSAPLSLLMLVPLVNFYMMFHIAFSEWPVRRELDELRMKGIDLE